jgi:hypothetical protein
MEPKPFMNSYESELKRLYNNPTYDHVPGGDPTYDHKPDFSQLTEVIHINLNERRIPKKVYICGSLKNCAEFLEKVFNNPLDNIIRLLEKYFYFIHPY